MGQFKVPVSPTGAGIICPGILQMDIACPIRMKMNLPLNEHTEM